MHDLAAWAEWKERCALGLCSDWTQSTLRQFVLARFHGFLRRYAHLTNLGDRDQWWIEPADAWHLFETHLTVNPSRAGKQYKDWLFARATFDQADTLDAVQGGATLLVRDVAREYLRREYSPPAMVSLNQPLAGSEDALSLEDLLPGTANPAGEAERHEYERLAREHAAVMADELTRRERVAILAKQLGVSLAHPAVAQAAGCGKSMVNQAWRDAVLRVATRLRADYAEDDAESVRMLTLLTLAELEQQVIARAKSENDCPRLFQVSEQQEIADCLSSLDEVIPMLGWLMIIILTVQVLTLALGFR